MKKKVGLYLLIGVSFFIGPSFAFTNICEVGEKALTMTSAQIKEYHKDEIKKWRVEGSGKVYDIYVNLRNVCTIIINCGNDVFVYVNADKYWGTKKDLKIGDEISFTGKCYYLRKKFYQNSNIKHIEAFVNKAYLDY